MNLHKDMTQPKQDEMFVFGSNQAGVHGAGAAYAARRDYGAILGVGEGVTGNCYAIPTKDFDIQSRDLADINLSVCDFVTYVQNHPKMKFFITKVGCGLAGFTNEEIAPMFHLIAENDNCSFPEEWAPYLEV